MSDVVQTWSSDRRPALFAVIPAAGASRRMGRPKLLLPLSQATLIEQVLHAWLVGGVRERIVVVRPDDEALARVCRSAGAHVVAPAAPPPEMKHSVQAALAFVRERFAPEKDAAWLLAPADMPRLAPAVIARLIAEHVPSAPRVLQPQLGGRSGHPVLFPWPLAEEAFGLGEAEGVNALPARHPPRIVPCDDLGLPGNVFADVDTPEDYHRLSE